MKPLNLAVIGFGKLGKACAEAIRKDETFVLAGIVRDTEHAAESLPAPFAKVPSASHISGLDEVHAALICVPTGCSLEVIREIVRHGIPIVECAELHGEAFCAYKREIDRISVLRKVPAIVGAGWDPGALSLLRSLFALLIPKGHTETSRRHGVSLHHTMFGRTIPGVRAALSTERRTAEGKSQRYVYVELENGAKPEQIAKAIRSDPLFLGEEILIFPVESAASFEEEGHGILMERHGSATVNGHQQFLLEARYSETALTAEIMLAAARAIPSCRPGAYSLFDLPMKILLGELRERREKKWL